LVRKAYHFWNYGFHPAGIGESLDLLRRAIQLDPGYASAYAFLALYLIERVVLVLTDRPEEDRAEANAAATKAVELAPQDAEVLENAGLVWLHCSEYNQSVESLRRAVQIAPFNLVAWGYLGLALGWGGKERDADEAEKILKKLIAETPEHPSLPYWHYFLSGTYIRLSRFDEAAALLHPLQIDLVRNVVLQPERHDHRQANDEGEAHKVMNVLRELGERAERLGSDDGQQHQLAEGDVQAGQAEDQEDKRDRQTRRARDPHPAGTRGPGSWRTRSGVIGSQGEGLPRFCYSVSCKQYRAPTPRLRRPPHVSVILAAPCAYHRRWRA